MQILDFNRSLIAMKLLHQCFRVKIFSTLLNPKLKIRIRLRICKGINNPISVLLNIMLHKGTMIASVITIYFYV